ncbi:hypothetical protein [Pelomonas cellulosilytica]|uniref:Lysozyme inhibitor LprI N-terminal domain-containing protein n=1 Tax=Pelomonas cellulosilytica TaxID=2906762 RepID=A0ABS8XQU4_9BURK|nr:hypothetical protein [Pelomonas sp. P8]MCE4554032.1 hypothetical protein [Pelomonas sp. P8]
MRRVLCSWLVLSACVPMLAVAAPVEYGTDAGWGRLLLDRAKRTVAIEVVGINGHSCDVQATLVGSQGDRAEAEACRFQLQPKGQGTLTVVVDEAARDACRENCGARAWFEGDYAPLIAACTRSALQRRQQEGLQAYRGKRFDAALQLWSQGLDACEKTMAWADVWRWRNDAAIAASHAGRAAECQKLSQAVLDDAESLTQPGDAEPFSFAPSDADTARPLIAAARHNLAKCGGTP